jgi:hypothetical protein
MLSPMKRTAQVAIVVMGLLTIPPLDAETTPSVPEQQQIIAVLKELQAQQAAIAENQTKIDAKLVALTEAIRVARIYSSRGGR